jgi:hypothetical protein
MLPSSYLLSGVILWITPFFFGDGIENGGCSARGSGGRLMRNFDPTGLDRWDIFLGIQYSGNDDDTIGVLKFFPDPPEDDHGRIDILFVHPNPFEARVQERFITGPNLKIFNDIFCNGGIKTEKLFILHLHQYVALINRYVVYQ